MTPAGANQEGAFVPIRIFLSLLAAALLAAPAPPARSPAALRSELTLRINGERTHAGMPPLAPSAALDRVAQARADEIKTKGALPNEEEAIALLSRVQLQMARAGYSAHGWTESQTSTVGDPATVMVAWRESAGAAQATDSNYQDVGIGVADLHGVPLYVFLFAWPRSEYFARQTAGLTDRQAVRDSMLAIVNAARTVEGRPPLVLDPQLNAAAQAHAEDMLKRTFYSHQSPEGSLPRRRVEAAGVSADVIGENIAAGQTSTENVMEAWMHSSDHRRNILEPRYTHLGVGLAVGSYEHKYKVLWVQDFARKN